MIFYITSSIYNPKSMDFIMVFIVHLLPMYIYLASFQMEPFFLFAHSFFHVARTKVKC